MDNNYINTRSEYIRRIRCELLGPGSEISIPDAEHELISSPPNVRYSIGVLFPPDEKINADNDESARVEAGASGELDDDTATEVNSEGKKHSGAENEAEEDNLDEEISLAAQNKPSSFGLTFFVKGSTDTISCSVSFATYRHAKAPDCRIPISVGDPENISFPGEVGSYVEYEKDSGCLHLIRGGLTKKFVSEMKEKAYLDYDEYGLFDALYKLCTQLMNGYVREPHRAEILLDFSDGDYIDRNRNIDDCSVKVTALRRKIRDDLYSVTIMLVNDGTKKDAGASCILQPEIEISTDKNTFVFQDYSGVEDYALLTEEEKSLELQYRNNRVYGSGLGVAVSWEISPDGHGVLKSDFFPEREVPNMDFGLPKDLDIPACALSMKYLSDLCNEGKNNKIDNLRLIVSAYRNWIGEQEKRIPEIDERIRVVAESNLEGCRRSCARMDAGLNILLSDNDAWSAFELANRAMYMQRVHLKIQAKTSNRDRYPDDAELDAILSGIDYNTIDSAIEDGYSWRPFQIAFLLMSVDSIVNDKGSDRELVDLIWFPTGGGKTEAYLGLTAFTIFFRRLRYPDKADGTSVIMRYTLRLLAAQQFTRASTLICACEYIRRDAVGKKTLYKKYPLGQSPITIGLWIGKDHTPNTSQKAREELDYLLHSSPYNLKYNKDRHNKFQVLKCPWCGTKLVKDRIADGNTFKLVGEFGYRTKAGNHFEMFCPQETCYFGKIGLLPIQIVDQELYLNPPTLLFGTVDKFAMLPWKKEIGNFFGIGRSNRPPELIIQDELHLISGPLGTMVGLYETAIDALCASKGVKSKIVASTATIRRAKEQCSALYNRQVAQFPHPALDASDSFFAREAEINHEKGIFGRTYVGLMPSGRTKAMMEVRAIAALMQTIHSMVLPDEIKDKYWTLTVYFNSLKDLGKCSTLVDDDVKDFIKRTVYRLGTARDARLIGSADELTSRVSTTELNETLDKLEKRTYSEENLRKKQYPSNILLATNMISVGIDVARLNVMLLTGQPKLTSEYIQASSRIGRSFPGVAFTMYDGSKSRDRSHFEQFKAYHESFYKYVEPTGVTPFSKPARDRALHAIVISLLRYLEPTLLNEDSAASFDTKTYAERIEMIKSLISGRNKEIVSRLGEGIADDDREIAEEIDNIIEKWELLAQSFDKGCFSYGEKYLVKKPEAGFGRLMKAFNTDPADKKAFETMTSMRNVDSTAAGNVLIWEGEQ